MEVCRNLGEVGQWKCVVTWGGGSVEVCRNLERVVSGSVSNLGRVVSGSVS